MNAKEPDFIPSWLNPIEAIFYVLLFVLWIKAKRLVSPKTNTG